MEMIGSSELIVIFLVILLLFGPNRLPELARSIGTSVKAYREGMRDKDKKLKG